MDILHEKIEQVNRVLKNDESLVHNSFYITYAFLMTTATITFIEAMRTKDLKVRNILNLETCISVVAAFFYSQFVDKIKDGNIDYEEINKTRYTDWSITTPIMLLVLCLAFLYNSKGGPLSIYKFGIVLVLNFFMLLFGYLGETERMTRNFANGIGFVFFAALYGYIYKQFIHKKANRDNSLLFWTFVILWSFYGVFYQMSSIPRNVGYNVLDLMSKCFVGIFFWAYFTRAFKI